MTEKLDSNKTLADAHPGGGVRLGDQAERARFEAWHREKFKTSWQTGAPTRDMHNGVYADNYGPAEEQVRWEAWQAALSAQPSPGGQDALETARELLAAEFDKNEVTAAAARRLRNHNETAVEAAALRVIAARQPVGEPVGTVHSGKYASGMPWCEVEWHIPQPAGTKLYAAPTQAVDLGQFRDLASDLLGSDRFDDYSPEMVSVARSAGNRLLALIDSKA